ncbi:MAG: tetratricopeptide repeat protein [Planctomycetota bacterium]
MGLFENMRRRREVEKLEEQARTNPGPNTFAELAEKLLAYGEETRALDVAKEASAKYPASEHVHTTHQYILRTHLQNRIRDLNRKLAQNPTPGDYAALAQLYYKDLGDRDAALETCRRGSVPFPNDENLHLVDGLVRYDRFHEDFLAKDGQRAVEHLEKAASLNARNYKAHALLAQMFVEIGALGRAKESLKTVLRLAPEDDRARQMLARVTSAAPGTAPETDLEQLFLDVERRGSLTREARAMVAGESEKGGTERLGRVDESKLAPLLGRFDTVEGVRGALVLTRAGETLASKAGSGISADTLADVVRQVYDVAEDSSKRMDIGSFVRGTIGGPFGTLHVVELRSLVLAVLAAPEAKQEQVVESIDKCLDLLASGAVGTV